MHSYVNLTGTYKDSHWLTGTMCHVIKIPRFSDIFVPNVHLKGIPI